MGSIMNILRPIEVAHFIQTITPMQTGQNGAGRGVVPHDTIARLNLLNRPHRTIRHATQRPLCATRVAAGNVDRFVLGDGARNRAEDVELALPEVLDSKGMGEEERGIVRKAGDGGREEILHVRCERDR